MNANHQHPTNVPKIQDLYPELDDEALQEAEENLRRYATLVARIYSRLLSENRAHALTASGNNVMNKDDLHDHEGDP